MITIANKSPFSGKINHMDIPMEADEFFACERKWKEGALIQDAFPTLSADEREFIKTGITPAEWETLFGED